MRALRLLASAAVGGIATLAACSSFDAGSGQGGPAPLVDGGSDAIAAEAAASLCGRPCSGAELCVAGACVPGCDGGVIYVAPDGDDSATGCAPGAAKKTVHAALDFARTARATTREIHACVGVYREPRLTLDVPVSLLGGYGCSTFKRADDYGYPGFPQTSASVLETDDAETLVVSGTVVDRSVRVDGWHVLATTGNKAATAAIAVQNGAAPSLSNLRAIGRQPLTSTVSYPSRGIRVESRAAPDIDRCAIDGGHGATSLDDEAGSVGVFIADDAGAVHLHDSAINGGKGRGKRQAAVGLVIRTATPLTGANAIERNVIIGGFGTTEGPTTGQQIEAPVEGLVATGGAFDLLDNRIEAGVGTCTGSLDCIPLGVSVTTTLPVPLRIERNRIYAGDLTLDSTTKRTQYVALVTSGGDGSSIVNNLVHLGNRTRIPNPSSSYGIAPRAGKRLLIAHNTIAASPLSPGSGRYYIDVATGETGTRIIDNLLLGTTSAEPEYGVLVRSCEGAKLAELRGNAFAGFVAAALGVQTGATCGTTIENESTIAGLHNRQNLLAPSSASANVRVSTECAEDTAACTSYPTCAVGYPGCAAGLVAFDPSSSGYANLVADGWPLVKGGPLCARSGVELGTAAATDILSRPRMAPVSIGAHEVDSCP